jgi:hypothetical protein
MVATVRVVWPDFRPGWVPDPADSGVDKVVPNSSENVTVFVGLGVLFAVHWWGVSDRARAWGGP